jgi:long-subunit acyl-CoA synthetase (AMP-forming)
MPKGAQLTHQNIVANILMFRTVTSVRENSIVLALLPFFHIYGKFPDKNTLPIVTGGMRKADPCTHGDQV